MNETGPVVCRWCGQPIADTDLGLVHVRPGLPYVPQCGDGHHLATREDPA